MARTTKRTKQSPKRDHRCIVLDANLQKHWRKTHCRDRNVRNRGYDPYRSENGYDRRHLARLTAIHLTESLVEAGLAPAPRFYEPITDEDAFYDMWDEYYYIEDIEADREAELEVRACGCVGAFCQYDEYTPFDDYDDADAWSLWDSYYDTTYGNREDTNVA
ncbi:hypothetical protein H7Y29_00880 [Microbacteriaceae bacterium]|nr:hypothetical protein [Candidatus Saccharibacteria bacterium]